jgi:hypothetical protein
VVEELLTILMGSNPKKNEDPSCLTSIWKKLQIQNLVMVFPPCENFEDINKSVAKAWFKCPEEKSSKSNIEQCI